MLVSDYVLQLLDQADPDDQLIDSDDVDEAARKAIIKDRSTLQELAKNDQDLELADSGLYVSMTMRDLFEGSPTASLERKTYIYSPRYYIFSEGRVVQVDEATEDPANYSYDETLAQLTFTSQQADGAEVVLKGLVVSMPVLMGLVLDMIIGQVETAPDVYASRNAEFAARMRRYKAREWTVTLP